MKNYVFYVFTAPGNMGGRWDGPDRRVIQCKDDDAARAKMREINANWASVLACFPEECEISLKPKSEPTADSPSEG